MTESIFNKKSKSEPFDIKLKTEIKKEVEDAELQAGLNVLETRIKKFHDRELA